ncbi:MAG: hypothetical protein IKU60_05745 [Clostridia bacterium]|nr:hypothetical protein [Clostridia bacterium]
MKKIISVMISIMLCIGVNNGVPSVVQAAETAIFTVDMSEKTGAVYHGSTGGLYALGSEGSPQVNLITPLKPSTVVQKAPDGMQHPTGDVMDVAKYFVGAGGKQVQIYMQDIFALWGYEYTGMDDYLERLEGVIPKVVQLKKENPELEGKMVYIPFNEPDGIWYTNINTSTAVQKSFNNDWLRIYKLIKSIDPTALIGGTSFAFYRSSAMDSWVKFCVENDCEPDYVTWHELQNDKLKSFKEHLDDFRAIEDKYGMEHREIVINEYAAKEHCSLPGKLVNWIALFEENKVSGCLPYWHNAGNFDDITADSNEPNGAWWLYKWYGDMSGETLKVATSTDRTELYGLASIDDNKKLSNVLFGGVGGNVRVKLANISKTEPFKDCGSVKIKAEATYWTAFHGVAEEPRVIMEGTYPVRNGCVTIDFSDLEATAAYRITVTQSTEEDASGVAYYGDERVSYEAENAAWVGGVYTKTSAQYAQSNGKRLAGMDTSDDGYDLTVKVAYDGYYKMDYIYGNGYGLNTSKPEDNNPITVIQTFSWDGGEKREIVLENTLRWDMAGMYTEYVFLEEGEHVLSVRGTDYTQSGASADCISFTYCGAEIPFEDKIYEAELGDFNMLNDMQDTTVTTEAALSGYSASGYVTGLSERSVPDGGGVRFVVLADDNALYNVSLRYACENDTKANIYLDNTALVLDRKVATIELERGENFKNAGITMFLQKGINIIDIDTDSGVALDYLRVTATKNYGDKTIAIQAEDGALYGNAQIKDGGYASGGKYVSNIEGATEDRLKISVNVTESGFYKMVIYHSNKELFGAHSYNAQIVDRYASYTVNGKDETRVHFKNTYSDENWRTVTKEIWLDEGENTIEFFNDNYKISTCGTLKEGTSSHVPENIEYHTLVNYTPNFDRFEFTPSVVADAGILPSRYKVSVMTTKGGRAYSSKGYAEANETINLTVEADDGYIAKVYANGIDKTDELVDNTLPFTIETDVEFKVMFTSSENSEDMVSDAMLYFVDCGDIAPETLSDGEKFGKYNSVTEQFFSEDIVTGKEWGIVDEYTLNQSYPNLLTGKDTWPRESISADNKDKVETFRYAKDQTKPTDPGITYKFELPDGEYAFELGFFVPSGWITSKYNRKTTLSINSEIKAESFVPSTNSVKPVVVKTIADISGGYATIHIRTADDGNGGPMVSYIKIYKALSLTDAFTLESFECKDGSAELCYTSEVDAVCIKAKYEGDILINAEEIPLLKGEETISFSFGNDEKVFIWEKDKIKPLVWIGQ